MISSIILFADKIISRNQKKAINVKSPLLPAHLPHHILIGKEGNPVDRERSENGDSQSLEKCATSFKLVLLSCAIP